MPAAICHADPGDDAQEQLIQRCVAGEAGAWAELHRQYRPQALAFLRRLGVRPREAEDACQEVFLQIVRYLARFEGRADFRTWLYKLCISQAERLRRSRWRVVLLEPLAWLRRAAPAAELPCSPARAVALVEGALGTLSLRQRTVLVLFELEGLPTADIARLLDCPAATVRRQLHEARRAFEAYLREGPLR
jgi:RNA polymerase sigma-70 factor, ECF subfamily